MAEKSKKTTTSKRKKSITPKKSKRKDTGISYTESIDFKTYDDITKALLAMTYDTNSLKELSETEDSIETVTATEPQAETPAEPSTDGATDASTEADTPTTDDAKTDDTAAADSDNHIFKSVSVKNEGGKYVFSAVLNRIGGEVQGYSMLRQHMITGTASERIGSGKYRSEIDRLVKAVM